MLTEESNRSRSLNAQKTFGTLSLDQFGTKEAVRDVSKMRVVVRIKKNKVSCTQ